MAEIIAVDEVVARAAALIRSRYGTWSVQRLEIPHFGFAPLQLPPDLDLTAPFHGVDERVPTRAQGFGAAVLHRFLSDC
ncbi:hypothetical protein GCM10022223_14860 [Kineosporia mesophila]|uniref:Uncharacterized protein n=1 Tax=Kineosporia mesophila TaxID=566012 RepID=A0ABP6Z7N1_9ACTN|nr:hypothetical protein [Kineosporia mesophila]MCD5352962.1 hypothetical protein [Kineosporia mesophila]